MFHRFCHRAVAPAWAGADSDPLFAPWFQHGDPFGQFGGGWGDDRRTRRGDIKFILLELLSDRPRHGYDLIKELEARFGGSRRLSPGSVYPTLQLLEEGGYLTSEQEGGKRVYTITDAGRQLLAERIQQSAAGSPGDAFENVRRGRSQELIELQQEATELAGVVMQVARSGNLERMNRVRESLRQVKREIYTMLAEE